MSNENLCDKCGHAKSQHDPVYFNAMSKDTYEACYECIESLSRTARHKFTQATGECAVIGCDEPVHDTWSLLISSHNLDIEFPLCALHHDTIEGTQILKEAFDE